MSFEGVRLVSPPSTDPVYCSGECYSQCSPESCPGSGLTAQCTDKCVVVACSDPHDGDYQRVCTDIICDDQACTDPVDRHGIFDFLRCCDDYHDGPHQLKSHNLDHTTANNFNNTGWDPTFDVLLPQGYQHGDIPLGYYRGITTSTLTSAPSTATMAVSSSRPSTPRTPNQTHSHDHSHTHQNVFQQSHPQQHIANTSPPFHTLTQADHGLPFESNNPGPHDISVGQTQTTEHPCMWANCHAAFGSLQDLVAHVNVQHLQTVSALPEANNQLGPSQDQVSTHHQSTLNPTIQTFPSCHWGGCNVYPTVENVPSSSDRPLDAALGVLAAHLWEYHFGLPTPPSQFTFPPPATTLVAENAGDSIPSPSLRNFIAEAQESPVEVEMIDVIPPHVPAPLTTTETDAVTTEIDTSPELDTGSPNEHGASPTQEQEHIHDQYHDCATTDHLCKWLDCQERFATCEDLMTHVTAKHVGSGKNYYGCLWEGCGRNGDNGFKSKQKICRHLQSHTGHRPHQCEVCQQCFSEAATLQQHMRRHTQEKPYQCDHPGCGKRFAIMGALTIHKRTHNGDKPFKCPQCDKAFSESSNLSKHLRTHTGVRPYVCLEPGCGKCFGRADQLTRHMNVHSGGGKVAKRAAAAATPKVA